LKQSLINKSILIIISLFWGCGTTKQWRIRLENEWLNKSKDALVAKRGKPFEINSVDVKGTEIYIYHHTDFTPEIAPNDYYEDYFINSAGIIYKIKTFAR